MTIPAASAGATPTGKGERAVRLSILWLLRVAGLALFGFGLVYWIRLVGVYPDAGWRFDLMPPGWRVAAPVLAVLCPVAGVGLWMTVSWGTVVWVLVAAIEAVMHFGLTTLFGRPPAELYFHLAGLGALGCLRLLHWRLRLRARRRDALG